jgi:hypothetical protein
MFFSWSWYCLVIHEKKWTWFANDDSKRNISQGLAVSWPSRRCRLLSLGRRGDVETIDCKIVSMSSVGVEAIQKPSKPPFLAGTTFVLWRASTVRQDTLFAALKLFWSRVGQFFGGGVTSMQFGSTHCPLLHDGDCEGWSRWVWVWIWSITNFLDNTIMAPNDDLYLP